MNAAKLAVLAAALGAPLPEIARTFENATDEDRERMRRQVEPGYRRGGGEIRHRRTWAECPECKTKCAKPGVSATAVPS